LRHFTEAKRHFIRPPMEDDVAMPLLWEKGEFEIVHELTERRLHIRPEPRWTEIEAIDRDLPRSIDRQNSSSEPRTRFQ
jgi:hypothetical protein